MGRGLLRLQRRPRYSDTSHIRFPRGFLLADRPVPPPPGYLPGPLLPNLHLHPWTLVDHAGTAGGEFVILLGTCVSTIERDRTPPVRTLLRALRSGEAEFLRSLDDSCGRHAVIYGTGGRLRVVGDATAMRSIFYAADGGIVSSHATLVERARGGNVERDDLPFRYGYPGNRTPFTHTRLLTANTRYDISSGEILRFWPHHPPVKRSVESAAHETLLRASVALHAIAKKRPVKLALTAGLDSRAMLAVVLSAGVKVEAYTYGNNAATATDRAVAAELCRMMNIPHTELPTRRPDSDLADQLAEAHYSPHHVSAIPSLIDWINDPAAVAVTANLLEIGRSFYHSYRRLAPPTTAEAMAVLHLASMAPSAKASISHYGEDRYLTTAVAAFQEFIDTTKPEAGVLDPFDQFYWEHRMGAWHGTAMVERDFYAEPFIPFNTRATFEAMLGVSQARRDDGSVLHRLIELVEPRLLWLPINPKTWPPETVAD